MEGRMSGYDTDDILSEALDLAENEDENIFITQSSFKKYENKGTYFIILCFTLHWRLGQRPPFLCNFKKQYLFFHFVFLYFICFLLTSLQ